MAPSFLYSCSLCICFLTPFPSFPTYAQLITSGASFPLSLPLFSPLQFFWCWAELGKIALLSGLGNTLHILISSLSLSAAPPNLYSSQPHLCAHVLLEKILWFSLQINFFNSHTSSLSFPRPAASLIRFPFPHWKLCGFPTRTSRSKNGYVNSRTERNHPLNSLFPSQLKDVWS